MDIIKNISPTEIIIIALILVVLFGSKKISQFGKHAGEATKEFKKVKADISDVTEELSKPKEVSG